MRSLVEYYVHVQFNVQTKTAGVLDTLRGMGVVVQKPLVSPELLPFHHTEHRPEGITMKEAPISH